jgi:hypothetical protein
MPMRGEISIPAARQNHAGATDAGACAIIALCTIGWLISLYFAFQVLTPGDMGVLYTQPFWG